MMRRDRLKKERIVVFIIGDDDCLRENILSKFEWNVMYDV